MLSNYETMFKNIPKEVSTPMIEMDYPEIDNSILLGALDIKQYQSVFGSLQWLVTLGHYDIHLGVATMAGYCCTPRQGHLHLLKCM
jgi:hypothetical protein